MPYRYPPRFAGLAALPEELHTMIATQLDFASAQDLAVTCTDLQASAELRIWGELDFSGARLARASRNSVRSAADDLLAALTRSAAEDLLEALTPSRARHIRTLTIDLVDGPSFEATLEVLKRCKYSVRRLNIIVDADVYWETSAHSHPPSNRFCDLLHQSGIVMLSVTEVNVVLMNPDAFGLVRSLASWVPRLQVLRYFPREFREFRDLRPVYVKPTHQVPRAEAARDEGDEGDNKDDEAAKAAAKEAAEEDKLHPFVPMRSLHRLDIHLDPNNTLDFGMIAAILRHAPKLSSLIVDDTTILLPLSCRDWSDGDNWDEQPPRNMKLFNALRCSKLSFLHWTVREFPFIYLAYNQTLDAFGKNLDFSVRSRCQGLS